MVKVPINDPKHWRERAEEARTVADELTDPDSKRAMLRIAKVAFSLVLQTDVLIAILLSSVYGLVVGSLPGLSATMATALLVPVTFYLSPIAAVATIIAASAMAIFSGDIPGALLRIPGTPASAAYTDEAYAMTRKGQPEMALGICVWFSALGGIAGTISLMALAPPSPKWRSASRPMNISGSPSSASCAPPWWPDPRR
jgi:TctA family transporter